jgi:predicted O-methyltransferase YrrM
VKQAPDAILRPRQAAYLERSLPPRDPLLAEMERLAAAEDIPISDPEVGRLLEALAAGVGARRILEVGTAIGYGALCLARGAPEARVVCLDNDPERLAVAREYLQRGGVLERVELIEGDALVSLERLNGPFDLAYLDATKTEYRRYLDAVLRLLRVGGMVVADNLLWGGRVAEPPAEEDEDTRALRAFNGYFLIHPQLTAVILPLGDGVGLATKRKPLIQELGGPF